MRGRPAAVMQLNRIGSSICLTIRYLSWLGIWASPAATSWAFPSGGWALRGHGMWACEKIDDGAFVGSVGIFQPLDWPEPEIAYSLDQPFWRQGFATEAAKAARDWLFARFPLPRAASFIRPDNHASKRVTERLGAVCERTFELRGATFEHWVHFRAGRQS